MLGLPPGIWSVGDGLVSWAIEEHVAGGMSTTMSFRGDVRGERMGNGAVTLVVVLSREVYHVYYATWYTWRCRN